MAQTYLDLITKLQQQGLTALKQAQDAHVAALTTARDMATQLATAPLPSADSVPSVSALTNVASNFATQVLEQQKSYANQLAGIFDAARKDAAVQSERFTPTTGTTKA